MGTLDFVKGHAKSKVKTEIRGNCSDILLEGYKSHFLHINHPNYPSFYLRYSRNYRKAIIWAFFRHFPKFVPLPAKFWGNPKLYHTSRCLYYLSWVRPNLVFLTYFCQKLWKSLLQEGGGGGTRVNSVRARIL